MKKKEFHPHMTIAQCNLSEVNKFIKELESNGITKSIKFTLKNVSIINRDEINKEIPFSLYANIALKPKIENTNTSLENININSNESKISFKTIIACDNTGSMGQSVKAMAESMSQVDAIFELTTGQRVIKAVVGD